MSSSHFVTGLQSASGKWLESDLIRPTLIFGGALGLGGASFALGWDLTEASGLLAGAALLAAGMVNTLLRVWSWADELDRRVNDAPDDPFSDTSRNQLRHRIDSLERVQAVSAWAVLTSLGLVGSLIVIEVKTANLDPAVAMADPSMSVVAATAVSLGLGWLVVMFFVTIIAETVDVGHIAVTKQRARLGAKSGPSERHS